MAATPADWVAELKAFTDRNAGRRTVLEVDIAEFGAQQEESDYPLKGVVYDPRDRSVQIMLGEEGSFDRHLTHSIPRAQAIDVRRSPVGRDEALCVRHANGQTLLRFHRS